MGSGRTRLTVVIPVWDSYVQLLPEALASAREQAEDLQVIVVDNASEPPVVPLAGCEVVRAEARLSRGAARNLGLSRVETEYVAFLDADDLLLPGTLSRLVEMLARRPAAQLAIGGIVEADGSVHRTPRRLARALARVPRLFSWAHAIWSLAPIQGCAAMRTAAVRECGGYPDASSAEDWVLGVSLAFRGSIVFDPEPVLVYRLRPDSPGASEGLPRSMLMLNAARVRDRLRADPLIMANRRTLAAIALVQLLVIFLVQPLVRAARPRRRRRRGAAEVSGRGPNEVRVLRVIARLNIGGPAIQAITLTRRLQERGYATTLVRGREGDREGTMDDLAAELGVEPVRVDALRREPGLHDLAALAALVRIMRQERPRIVHTHAAKGGTLGRTAAIVAFPRRRRRPLLVHTFHGHSLTGYFSRRTAAIYRLIEQVLARYTDKLIAVSEEVRDELVALGVAAPESFVVIPLGFDLERFAVDADTRARARAAVREELDIPADATLVTLIARLVPIKRVDRFLRSAQGVLDVDNAHFLVVGDGELGEALRTSPEAQSLGARLIWAGFRRDIPAVCAASDVIVLTSDNEGTPVSLIEAGAAGLPAVGTRVGGAASVVRDGETGVLVTRDDGELTRTLRRLTADPALREQMGAAARAHVLATFSLERLIANLDGLYRELLRIAASRATS